MVPDNTAAILKYAGAKVAQDRGELLVEAMGQQGLGWSGEGFSREELAAMGAMLRTKANSIEGGTSEINLNIVSKRVLGLPDPRSKALPQALSTKKECHGPRMRATQVVSTGFDGSSAFNLLCCTKRELGGPHSRAMTPLF